MPVLMPTPEELARMSWHQRQKVSANVRRMQKVTASLVSEQWGAKQRDLAAAHLAVLGFDPDAEAHRIALMEAM